MGVFSFIYFGKVSSLQVVLGVIIMGGLVSYPYQKPNIYLFQNNIILTTLNMHIFLSST
jgi:hypothetical protein